MLTTKVIMSLLALSSLGSVRGTMNSVEETPSQREQRQSRFRLLWAHVHLFPEFQSLSLSYSPPTLDPSQPPTGPPSRPPTKQPSLMPSVFPSVIPSHTPSSIPSKPPTRSPSGEPTLTPSQEPSGNPTSDPSTSTPTKQPSLMPSVFPSVIPSHTPSSIPSKPPTRSPSGEPTLTPSQEPSGNPTSDPSTGPSNRPSITPTDLATVDPSSHPSDYPTTVPSQLPSVTRSNTPSSDPSHDPSSLPSPSPTPEPTPLPSKLPSLSPSHIPSIRPTVKPTIFPSGEPTHVDENAGLHPGTLTSNPTESPSTLPTQKPTVFPSTMQSPHPSRTPSENPTEIPTLMPSPNPSRAPSAEPTETPTLIPSTMPSPNPSRTPSVEPTERPSPLPSRFPSPTPSSLPSSAPSNKQCEVAVGIDCKLSSGEKCEFIMPLQGKCSGEPVSQLEFRLLSGSCGESWNDQPESSCIQGSDSYDAVTAETIFEVSCTSSTAELNATPSQVSFNDRFVVSNLLRNKTLPSDTTCSVRLQGEELQRVAFDASGTKPLSFKDKFGSFQIEGCNSVSCSTPILLIYTFSNDGTGDMFLTKMQSVINGNVQDLVKKESVKSLLPGEVLAVSGESSEVDRCQLVEQSIQVTAEADPLDGQSCQNSDDVSFKSVPDCIVKASMTCTTIPRGKPCLELTGQSQPQCYCKDCVRQLNFQYRGRECGNLENTSTFCRDAGRAPLAAAKLRVFGASATALYEGMVFQGDSIPIISSSCIGSFLALIVSNPVTDEVVQHIVLQTVCNGGSQLVLGHSYGSLYFSGYSCLDGETRNCFANLQHDFVVSNRGQVNVNLSELSVDINGDQRVLTSGQKLKPEDSTQVSVPSTVDLCQEHTYDIEMLASGSSLSMEQSCQSTDRIIIDIVPGSHFPTMYPTIAPTKDPTPLPSTDPTLFPSDYPTSAPVELIETSSPTQSCNIEVEVNCTLPDGSPCTSRTTTVIPCTGRPTQMGMLLRGGFCNQSDNIQPDKFFCEDFNEGPPEPRSQDSVYIVVTDGKGKGRTYFTGPVLEGNVFTLDDGGLELEADSTITIFSDETMQTVLQNFTFHSSCSQNLRLKDTFGATQLVQWFNTAQGNITCFADVQLDLTLSLPFTTDGDGLTLDHFYVLTNFGSPPTRDLTDEFGKTFLAAGSSIAVEFNSTFDLTEKRQYEITSAIQGTSPDGLTCIGFDRHSFWAGSPAPPALPTPVPTFSPTITSQPTPNPDDTPCDLIASIQCGRPAANHREEPVLCQNLKSPRGVKCEGSNPFQLRFLYTGEACAKHKDNIGVACADVGKGIRTNEPVLIVVKHDKDDIEYFREFVMRGSHFTLGPTSKKVRIEVLDKSMTLLQKLELRTDCKSDKTNLVVGQDYGALQLEGFQNSIQGSQNVIQDLEYTFTMHNRGLLPATLQWANRTGLILGDQEHFGGTGPEISRGETVSLRYPFQLNLMAAAGSSFDSSFQVSGIGKQSGLPCFSRDEYSFTVGEAD